ncbi:MAG: CZB domain-containing protein [Chloroherpetonaceae bacterium]
MSTSFKQWISNFISKQNTTESTKHAEHQDLLPEIIDPIEVEAAGLNFHTAIISHQNWKARFRAMIDSGITEALNPDIIAQDNQCAVGKWIYGPAKHQFGDHSLYEKLRLDHQFFHIEASRVLVMIIRGDKQKALHELESGIYARASNDVIMDLAMLYRVLKPN